MISTNELSGISGTFRLYANTYNLFIFACYDMIKAIQNKKEYDHALRRYAEVLNAKKGTKESRELSRLTIQINKYEQRIKNSLLIT